MKKSDLIIIIIGLLTALAVYGGLQLNQQQANPDEKVVEIYQDGQLQEKIALEEEGTYRFDSEYGYNVVEISNGEASIVEANCPTLSCVHEGGIDHVNETVVCLPHRFHIVIKGNEGVEIDAISQ